MTKTLAPLITLNNKSKIPCVGLGTYLVSSKATDNIVYEACKRGYRHFDTAVLYENERDVAAGIVKYIKEESDKTGEPFDKIRSDFFYTTKLWNDQCSSYEAAHRGIESCLSKIGDLKYIDLLLIHSPLMGPENRLLTWKAMQEYDVSKVKNLGVSNYGIKHLRQLLTWKDLKIKPVINQIEISPWLMRQEIVDFCKENDIQVEAYAPLTHGGNLFNPLLTQIAYKYEVTNAQILIRWSLQHGLIPLPKTGTIERLSGNLDVFGFEIDDKDMRLLDHPEAYQPTDWECTDCP